MGLFFSFRARFFLLAARCFLTAALARAIVVRRKLVFFWAMRTACHRRLRLGHLGKLGQIDLHIGRKLSRCENA